MNGKWRRANCEFRIDHALFAIHSSTFAILIAAFMFACAQPVWCQTPAETPSSSQSDEVANDEFNLPLDHKLAATIDRLIPLLGSPIYRERKDATEHLITIGAPAFEKLRAAYADADEFEVRLRIEKIVHQAYLDHHVFDRNAFLGIRQVLNPRTHADDPRILEGHFGVQIQEVIADTCAKEAGIAKGDVIVALDDEPLKPTDERPATAFGESIRVRGPGTTMKLTILRGKSKFDMEVTLGRRPKQFYVRQGVVTEMLMQVEQDFGIWWVRYFRSPRTNIGSER